MADTASSSSAGLAPVRSPSRRGPPWSRPWARKVRSIVRRILDYVPLTGLGALVLGGALVAYWGFGVPRIDYVLMLVGLLAMALVGLAVISVIPGAVLVHQAHRRFVAEKAQEEVVLEAERGVAILMRLPSFRAFPLIDLSWTWVEPPGFAVEILREGPTLVEKVEARGRAHVDHVVRKLDVEDAFGLARITLHRTDPQKIRVLPFPGKLGSAPMLRSHAGGEELPHPLGAPEGDRVEMRHYAPGDPLRLALWKLFARTGELMVRMPERAISPSWRIVAYLISAEKDEPASAAARVAIENGLFGEGWRFSADGAQSSASSTPEALALVSSSRSFRGTPEGDGAGLPRFIDEVGDGPRTRLILFVPAVSGPWIEGAQAAIRAFGGAVTAVVATDRVIDEVPASPLLERWIRRPPPPEGREEATTTTAELGRVGDMLADAGALVVAVERPGGRVLAERRHGARRVA